MHTYLPSTFCLFTLCKIITAKGACATPNKKERKKEEQPLFFPFSFFLSVFVCRVFLFARCKYFVANFSGLVNIVSFCNYVSNVTDDSLWIFRLFQ